MSDSKKSESLKIARQVKGLPETSGVLAVLIFLALLIHLFAISLLPKEGVPSANTLAPKPIRISIAKPKDITQKDPNQLLFQNQAETKPPKNPDFYSFEDHQAKNESQLKPGKEGQDGQSTLTPNKNTETSAKTDSTSPKDPPKAISRDEAYQKFLPSKQILAQETAAGYKDYLDQEMTLGETSDANSLKHPLMGFFSQIRRNVELAFYDPSEMEVARYMNSNGLSIIRGTSIALIEIDQSGKIVQLKLANPSGHTIIDEHWLKILRASSPFQPIPRSWPKDHLKFTYTLNYRYGSG